MLTLQDIKTLESLFIVEMHSAERIFRLIETGMETIYRESKDYKALVKRHGERPLRQPRHPRRTKNGITAERHKNMEL